MIEKQKREGPLRDMEFNVQLDGIKHFLDDKFGGCKWQAWAFPGDGNPLTIEESEILISKVEDCLRCFKNRVSVQKRRKREELAEEIEDIESEINDNTGKQDDSCKKDNT